MNLKSSNLRRGKRKKMEAELTHIVRGLEILMERFRSEEGNLWILSFLCRENVVLYNGIDYKHTGKLV